MVVCLSGSFIISDTFVWWMLHDDAGSDICLMAACRNKDTSKFYSCNNTHLWVLQNFKSNGSPSLHRRSTCNLTWLPISLFCSSNNPPSLLPEMHFEFPFKVINKPTMTFLMGQSWWRILKPGDGQEQVVFHCFADGPKQKFSSVCGGGYGFP